MSSAGATPSSGVSGDLFTTTHWTVVVAAGGQATAQAERALAELCRTYWYPLYAYVRRRGYGKPDAEDLTQGFFAAFLKRNYLGGLAAEKGRFRAFLLAAMKHYLANEWDRAGSLKRGAGQEFIALDAHDAESRYALEPQDELGADRIYERRWALLLLERVLGRLKRESAAAGRAAHFEELKGALSAADEALPYAGVAARLGTSEAAVKVAVHRLRKRYRELLRAEITPTVSCAAEVEDEVRYLFTVLGG